MHFNTAALAQHPSQLLKVRKCAILRCKAELKGKRRTVGVLARAWALGSTCLCPDLSSLNVRTTMSPIKWKSNWEAWILHYETLTESTKPETRR